MKNRLLKLQVNLEYWEYCVRLDNSEFSFRENYFTMLKVLESQDSEPDENGLKMIVVQFIITGLWEQVPGQIARTRREIWNKYGKFTELLDFVVLS